MTNVSEVMIDAIGRCILGHFKCRPMSSIRSRGFTLKSTESQAQQDFVTKCPLGDNNKSPGNYLAKDMLSRSNVTTILPTKQNFTSSIKALTPIYITSSILLFNFDESNNLYFIGRLRYNQNPTSAQ